MTLRMGDGPTTNLPAGLDAYAGYVDNGGIGITWPGIQQIEAKHHMSISIHGAPADCGDVEKGALTSWKGYTVGYCAISNAQSFINQFGRPRKLWTAHYDPALGAHICSPACGFGFTGQADGTQWTDHGGAWDESLLADNFFDYQTPATPPPPQEDDMVIFDTPSQPTWWWTGTRLVGPLTAVELGYIRDQLGVPYKELNAAAYTFTVAQLKAQANTTPTAIGGKITLTGTLT